MAGLAHLALRQARGVVSLSPRPLPSPSARPGLGVPLSHRVPVCWWSSGRWAGAGPGQMVCTRPYLLGVGGRAGAWRSSFTKPALSPLAAGPQELALLPSCPTKGLPSTTADAAHAGTPSLPVPARSKPKPGMPQVRPSRGHQGSNSKRGSRGGSDRACGIWAVADGPRPCLGRH